MHINGNDIVDAAKTYIGVRYREQGRNRNGLDCAGLIVCAGVDADAFHPHAANTIAKNYSRRPNAEEFTKHMIEAGCTRLRYGDHTHGDILRLAFSNWPVHIGIYEIDERGIPWIIHAYLPMKKVVREPLSRELESIISTVWRYPE